MTDDYPVLRRLLNERQTAALGTMQRGAPFVSMTPFAVSPDGCGVVIHVSRLAGHTRNMLESPEVSVLIVEGEMSDRMPQQLARVTIQGAARVVSAEEPQYPPLREAYLQRFPSAAPLFEFPDFNLFLIETKSARLVSGFAQATSLNAEQFAALALGND